MSLRNPIDELAELMRSSKNVVALTGAGISTESGIPDFRSPGGLYSQIDPMEYLSVESMKSRPEKFWRGFAQIMSPMTEAPPNNGHFALAQLENARYISTVITQNIDGLHQKAGSKNVIELHGHLRTAHCYDCSWDCSLTDAIAQLDESPRPFCPLCGEPLRPNVVLFGDIPAEYPHAETLVAQGDLLIVVGSSLSVSPANILAFRASRLAIINRDQTEGDRQAEAIIRGNAGESLTLLTERLI